MARKDYNLTTRELDVMKWLAQGRSDSEIAKELGITTSTVKFHLGNIYGKMKVSGRVEALLKWIKVNNGN